MPTKKGELNGTWNSGKDNISMKVPVILFEEDGCQIMYCPALDVSGYGNTEEEARNSFHEALNEFLLYTTHKKTFVSELRKLGWVPKKSRYKSLTPPSMTQLLTENENFSRIFNSFPFRKVDESITLPC